MDLPVKFEALARAANTPVSGAYPYSLKGRDLDTNFNAVAIDIDSSWVSESGNGQRTLLLPPVPDEGSRFLGVQDGDLKFFPAPPASGTYVLGAVDGSIRWISTEEC
jgi:hypothetical protein